MKDDDPTTRRPLLVATPLTLAVLVLSHPVGGERVYEGIRDQIIGNLSVFAAIGNTAWIEVLVCSALVS